MEPRARAGKNVGKMNFGHPELAQLLFSHGDSRTPLNETVRVLDEIVTEFIQGVAFEAARAAHHAGRQKVKFEDFIFALRRNSRFLGKVQEVFEKKKEIEAARKNFNIEDQLTKDTEKEEKEKGKEGGKEGGGEKAGNKRGRPKKGEKDGNGGKKQKIMDVGEEDLELDEGDDDLEL
ncbi:transcription initiation factor IID [Podospora fimiseda]|uniref:Transcription initiation factor TFIID subunit 13 n=1 Tax=Podospora fimiseda TaxID=252190 RepID=A0AAN7BEW3_9PEZI|nr:transcription initiation factor IID [Podospora fimiseda]